MAITKTVGVGGDFADYKALSVWFYNNDQYINSLGTNFIINQISDIDQIGEPAEFEADNQAQDIYIEINGNNHITNVTSGYGILLGCNQSKLHINVHHCDIRLITSDHTFGIVWRGVKEVEIHHNKIGYIGNNTTTNIGLLSSGGSDTVCSIYSNLFYKMSSAIYVASMAVYAPATPLRVFENNAMFNCGTGYLSAFHNNMTNDYESGFKINSCIFLRNDSITGKDYTIADSKTTFTSCASTTNTFNINVTVSDVTSIVYDNDDFLRPVLDSNLLILGSTPIIAFSDYNDDEYRQTSSIGAYRYYTAAADEDGETGDGNEYYVNPNGSETYPFDTEVKGAKDVNRLYKYLHNRNSKYINQTIINSYSYNNKPLNIPPFPSGDEKVVFKTRIKEYELLPLQLGVGPYHVLPTGTMLGTMYIELGLYSFTTVVTYPYDTAARCTYTSNITKGGINEVAFTKELDKVMDYYWVVDEYFVKMYSISPEEILDIENDTPIWTNNHGFNTWYQFFGNGKYQKVASGFVNGASPTIVLSMLSYLDGKESISFTENDSIYLTSETEEIDNLYDLDALDSYTHTFNYATLISIDEEVKSNWVLSGSNYYYNNLNLDNLNISTNYGGNEIVNTSSIKNCNFDDTWQWGGISFSNYTFYDEGKVCEISNNTFNGAYMYIYDSDGLYNLEVFNNIFKNDFQLYIDEAIGTHNIYNNVFDTNSYVYVSYRYEINMAECKICNNTFINLEEGYDAIYVSYRDEYGATCNLKIINNIIDSADIYVTLTAVNIANIIAFDHLNNCCPVYDYKSNNVVVSPDVTEISTDPLFDTENLEYPLMLTSDSPCADTGVVIEGVTPLYDILGTARGSTPDMGAYEVPNATVSYRSHTVDINYAIEIYPNSKDVWSLSDTYGIQSDAIRLITGRPSYLGTHVVGEETIKDNKFYGENEINIIGDDISELENEYKYYEGLITKEGLSGPDLSIDLETIANCNLDIDFGFSIRNDSGFYNYLKSNNIILNNRKVKFYVVIDDVFHSVGIGEIANITQSETSIDFQINKSFKQIDKQIPNTYVTTDIDEDTGEFKEEVMPIILGDVDHSKIMKEESKILPIVLGDNDNNIVPAIYYDWFDPIHHEASWSHETGYYPYIGLYTGSVIFTANDTRIMGEAVGEYPYTYPNRKWLFVKYGEKAPEGMFRILGNSESVNGYTYIHLETNLINSDDEILNPSNFNSTLSINPLVYPYVHDTYNTLDDLVDDLNLIQGNRFYIFAEEGYDTGDHLLSSAKGSTVKKWDIFVVSQHNHPYPTSVTYIENSVSTKLSYGNLYSNLLKGNENTWWFQIVDINVNTIVSSDDNFEIQTNDNNEIIAETYNKDTKKYESVSKIIDVNSDSSNLIIKGNKILEDETLYTYRRMPFKLLAFGACINSSNWMWDNNGFTGLLYYNNESHYYPDFFTTFSQADIDLVTNNKRNINGVDNHIQWKDSYISQYDYTHYSYVHAKFEVNKTLDELPDNVLFLVDCNRSSDQIMFNLKIGNLQWYAYDVYGNLIYSNNSGVTLSETGWVLQEPPEVSHYNMFPNEFYKDEDLNGDYYTMFDAQANNGTDNNKKQLKLQLNLKKSEIPISFDNVIKSDIIKEFVVILGFYHEFLHCDDWSKFKFEIKQLGIIAEEEVSITDDDIFVKVKGERCSLTTTEHLAETNTVYTTFVKLLEDYCKIDKKFIDYNNMKQKRFSWKMGRTLTDRQNSIEYINELSSNSFTQVYLTRNGKIGVKPFDHFNIYKQDVNVETYEGESTYDIYHTYGQVRLFEDFSTYTMTIGYKTEEQVGTDEFTFLYNYKGNYEKDGENTLNLYNEEGQNIYNVYVDKLGEEDGIVSIMLIMNEQIHFIIMYFTYNYQDIYVEDKETTTIIHDKNLIIRDSLSDVEVTDISNTYNNFKIQYNYDENENKFLKSLSINKVDELEVFPSEKTNDWQSLVVGIIDDNGDPIYNECKFMWDACKENYDIFGALQDAQAEITELNWYNNDTFTYNQLDNSARKYFKLIIQWLTKQKQMISYSIPISSDSVKLNLLDMLYFNDVILTNGENKEAFIIDKYINTDDDTVDLKIMLLPESNSNSFDTIIETGINEDTIEESGIETEEYHEHEI